MRNALDTTSRRLRTAAAGGLIVALTLLAYLPSLRNGFIWDDDHYVTGNLELRTPGGLASIWFTPTSTAHSYHQYYPLVHTTYWLEHHLWQLHPAGYHLVNVLLHALCAVLLWRVLQRLQLPGAWFAAALFALHPVHVESVAWITERKNVLSGAFYLGAALTWLRFAGLDPQRPAAQGRWRWYWAAFGLFTCALLSKTVACTFPAAALLVLWWKHGRVRWREAALMAPFVVLGLALGLTTAWLERASVGAVGAEWDFTPVERCLIAARALWFYAAKLAWPNDLTFIYPRWEIDAGLWWQWIFVAAALAVPAALWLWRHRLGRGPLAALLFFAVTLGPALGFVNVYPMRYSFVADHFQYLASAGLIALGAAAGASIVRRRHAVPAALLAATILAWLGTLTWRQELAYANQDTLWQDTLAKNPECWLAHNNLGLSLAQQGRLEEAIGHFEQSLRFNPQYDNAHNNLGTAELQAGRVGEGIGHLEQALRINPQYAEAHSNLGNALMLTDRPAEAIAHFEQALRFQPDYADAHNNLALALMAQGNQDEAIAHFEQVVRIQPDLPHALSRLGAALAQARRLGEAIKVQRQEVLARPGNPVTQHLLGVMLKDSGDIPGAMAACGEALRIQADFAPALNDLAWILATTDSPPLRNGEQAVRLAERACQLTDHQRANYLATLAAAYAEAGRFDEAEQTARRALALATSARQDSLATTIASQVDLYRSGHAWREAAANPEGRPAER